MAYELFDSDPLLKTKQYFASNTEGTEFSLVTVEDQTPVLQQNYDLRKETDRRTRWGDGQLVASIPALVWMDLWQQGIVGDEAAFKRWLNNPENVVFRRRLGKV